jgi:hypothetical protein
MQMKKYAKTLVGFAAGFICAGLLAVFLLTPLAAQGFDTCFSSDLKYHGPGRYISPDLPVILYSIPSCIEAKGWKPGGPALVDGNKIMIIYSKK